MNSFNKRGQELTTGTIVLIVLGVFVLAILIFGFTKGWSNIAPWLSDNNVDSVAKSCEIACSSDLAYNYCSVQKELNDAEGNKIKATCEILNKAFPVYEVPACSNLCTELVSCEEINVLFNNKKMVVVDGACDEGALGKTTIAFGALECCVSTA